MYVHQMGELNISAQVFILIILFIYLFKKKKIKLEAIEGLRRLSSVEKTNVSFQSLEAFFRHPKKKLLQTNADLSESINCNKL